MAVAALSVLVIESSARGPRVSMSVAELFAGVGSTIPVGVLRVAVLVSVPLAEDAMSPVRV